MKNMSFISLKIKEIQGTNFKNNKQQIKDN